jgi:hypothetical protein
MDSEFPMRRWAVVALALVAAVAIGTVAYQAGVSQGIALQPPAATAPVAPGAAQATPPPYPYYPYRYYGRGPFGFFGFVGPLFGLIFFIFIMRTIFWGLFGWGWGWRRRWMYRGYDPDYGPSRFDDWHRRAHERMRDDHAPAPPSA